MSYADYAARRGLNIKRHLESDELTPEMRKELTGFHVEYQANKRVSVPTMESYVRSLGFFGRWLKVKGKQRFKDVEKQDLLDYIGELNGSSDSVRSWFKIAIKTFLRWRINGTCSAKDGPYPEVVSWLRVGVPKNRVIQEQDLPTLEEFKRMLMACGCQRDRAFLFLLWECGPRIGELLECKRKDVRFEESGTTLFFPHSKTIPRRVPVFDALPDLKLWLEEHPDKQPEAWLFVDRAHGNPWKEESAWAVFRRIAKRAGLEDRKFHPHNMRHASCDRDRRSGMNDDLLRLKYGWSNSSRQVSRYSKTTFADIQNFERERRGIKEKAAPLVKSSTCPRCAEIVPFGRLDCPKCGQATTAAALQTLDEEKKIEADIVALLKQPKLRAWLLERSAEIKQG